jgi:hypothetical protein
MARTPNLLDYTNTESLQKGLGKESGDLLSAGSTLLDKGGRATDSGINALMPLISHFAKIVSGSASDIDAEAASEVGGVKSAYQSARDNITNFTPRGGGLSSSLAASRTAEAGDVAKVRSSVRKDAESGLAQVSQILSSLGLSEQQLGVNTKGAGIQGMGKLLDIALKQDEDSSSLWGKIGGTIGAVAGSFLFPPAAPELLGGAASLWK